MTVQALRFLHPNKICICQPTLWGDNGRVVDWHCVRVVDDIEAARTVIARLELDNWRDLVAIPTSEEITIEGDLTARFCRVYYGMRW